MTTEQRQCLDEVIGNIKVAGPLSEDTLRKKAIAHYKEQWKDTPFMLESAGRPSQEQLEQWMVNYVRHELTGYDEAWMSLGGKVPGGCAAVKHAVLDKIAEMYPFLREACERQKERCFRTW